MFLKHPLFNLQILLSAGLLTAAVIAFGSALSSDEARFRIEPPRVKPQPGSVRLKNGLILSGMTSTASSLAPEGVEVLDQGLELRLIDQGARKLYVSNRRSEAPVINNLEWPVLTFSIPQKRVSRDILPRAIPDLGPFDSTGVATGTLRLTNGRVDEIKVAITSVNELYAEVTSLTHDWKYSIAFDAIPRQILFPGILQRVSEYDTKPFCRLELVRMLIKGNRLPEAGLLLQTLNADFPDVAAEQAEYQQSIREQLARQIASELEQRRDAGQHKLASNGARVYPQKDLTPETVVRVGQLMRDYDDLKQRIEFVRQSLHSLTAEVQNAAQRASANEITQLILTLLDEDSINRFSAFELISDPANAAAEDGPAAEEKLAMAFSGWLMDADHSLKSLPDAIALFEARQSVIDYLCTDPDEIDVRRGLADQISKLEGVSVDRIAALVRQLPSVQPVRIEVPTTGVTGVFRIESRSDMAGAVGIVPPEYHETRQYPVVIAFSGEFYEPEKYLKWWQEQAAGTGCIVVVPQWHSDPTEDFAATASKGYDASADKHTQFLNLVRTLKLSLRIDDDRVFVAGHGFGGETAMDMVTSHPDLFAGVISICGLGRKHLQWTAWNAVELPWYVVIGDGQNGWFDRMALLARKLFRRSEEKKLFADVLFVKYPGRGAESYIEEADDIFSWMALHKRERYPQTIQADLMRSTDLRWYWLKLDSIPAQFARLDAPSTPLDEGFKTTELKVRLNDKNSIIVEMAPGNVTLFLAPDMPGLDILKPISIVDGRKRMRVDFNPEIRHLLEELYTTGDRSRLCYMKVEMQK